MSNDLIPSGDSGELNNQNIESSGVPELLFNYDHLQYDIIQMRIKGIDYFRIANYIQAIINDESELEFLKLPKRFDYSNVDKLADYIEDWCDEPDNQLVIETCKDNSRTSALRKVQLEIIEFGMFEELIRKYKRGEFSNMTAAQLVNASEKMLKMLHLEEDRNKDNYHDGIKTIKDHFKVLNINPIITSEVGFNIYDKGFFGETANDDIHYVDSKDIIEGEYERNE